jgi:hypothetical protein
MGDRDARDSYRLYEEVHRRHPAQGAESVAEVDVALLVSREASAELTECGAEFAVVGQTQPRDVLVHPMSSDLDHRHVDPPEELGLLGFVVERVLCDELVQLVQRGGPVLHQLEVDVGWVSVGKELVDALLVHCEEWSVRQVDHCAEVHLEEILLCGVCAVPHRADDLSGLPLC